MLAVHAGYAPALLGTLRPPAARRGLRIMPAAAGSGDGSSWDNAGALGQLDAFVAVAAATGSEVWVRADAGSYAQDGAITIAHGGSAGKPVPITGTDINGLPMLAEIVGGRASPWSAGAAPGSEVFRLNAGADHLAFSWFRFRNQGSGCIRVRADVADLTITDCEALNVSRFFEDLAPTAVQTATITGLTIQRVEGHGFSKNFIRIQYASTNILIEHVDADSERQDGDNFATGISFYGTANTAALNRCTMRNIIDTLHAYQNGDGYSGERGNHHITLTDCAAFNCTDGGCDFKGDDITLVRFHGEGNHRNIRLWGLAEVHDPVCITPKLNAGPNIYGMAQISAFWSSRVRVFGGTISQDASCTDPPFRAETGAMLCLSPETIAGCTKPDSVDLYSIEDANNGDPGGQIVTMDPSDTTPPTITTTLAFTIDENKVGSWDIGTSKPAQLRFVSGDADAIGAPAMLLSVYGDQLRMARQDYEQPAHANNQLSGGLVAYDANGNVSVPLFATITINNVDDNPIAPAELFGPGGATDGAWFEVDRLDTLWQDTAGTVPAVIDQPVARIDDLSGFGHHALQPDPGLQWYLRSEGGLTYLAADGRGFYLLPVGTLRFAQVSAFVMQRRDPADTATRVHFAVPRAASTTNGSNGVWWLGVNGGASMQIHLQSASFFANGVGGTLNQDQVLSMQSELGEGRSNETLVIDRDGVSPLVYSSSFSGQPRLGADGDGGQAMIGRFYGAVVTNRTEVETVRFRINRQLAAIAGVSF